jgi:hypothetical protein
LSVIKLSKHTFIWSVLDFGSVLLAFLSQLSSKALALETVSVDNFVHTEAPTHIYIYVPLTSNQVGLPAELKHINKRRKRN